MSRHRYAPDSDHLYSLDEMVRYRCRFDDGWPSPEICAACFLRSLEEREALYPLWRRRRFPVRSLRSFHSDVSEGDDLLSDAHRRIFGYVARRRAGGRFPPIVVLPSQNYPLDGNHRLRAAQIVGDEEIDAFVPVVT